MSPDPTTFRKNTYDSKSRGSSFSRYRSIILTTNINFILRRPEHRTAPKGYNDYFEKEQLLAETDFHKLYKIKIRNCRSFYHDDLLKVLLQLYGEAFFRFDQYRLTTARKRLADIHEYQDRKYGLIECPPSPLPSKQTLPSPLEKLKKQFMNRYRRIEPRPSLQSVISKLSIQSKTDSPPQNLPDNTTLPLDPVLLSEDETENTRSRSCPV